MALLIPTPRLARFSTMEDIVLGPYQKAVLDIVAKAKGRKAKQAKAGTITSTGKIRKHIFDDLVGKAMLQSRVEPKLGGTVYLLTALGERARKQAAVAKAPPSGYRKALPAPKRRRAA